MTIKARSNLSDDEQHLVNLDLQKIERQSKRLADSDEVSASLIIWHDTDPEIISESLGLIPDNSRQKNRVLEIGRWESRSTPSYWTITSKQKVKETIIEEHLKWLVSQISGKLPQLRRLQNSGAKTYVAINLNSRSRAHCIEISVETSQLLASYRLPVQLLIRRPNTNKE